MKEQMPQHEHYLRGHKDAEDISKLSEKLTPPEETDAESGSDQTSQDDNGTLLTDTGALKLPQGFEESQHEKRGMFGLDPAILVILILALAFIAFIAYLVYLTPAK